MHLSEATAWSSWEGRRHVNLCQVPKAAIRVVHILFFHVPLCVWGQQYISAGLGLHASMQGS